MRTAINKNERNKAKDLNNVGLEMVQSLSNLGTDKLTK